MWKNYGVKLYYFVAFQNTKGQNITCEHRFLFHTAAAQINSAQVDFGQRLYGQVKNFREIARPPITKSGVWNRWQQYTRATATETNVTATDNQGALLRLPLNEWGEPIIPNPDVQVAPTGEPFHKYMAKVVRCVVAHCYGI